MIELDHDLDLRGLPTAKCTTHYLVLQAQSFSEHGTLTLIWSCPCASPKLKTHLK